MQNTKDTALEIDHLSDVHLGEVRGGLNPLLQPGPAAFFNVMAYGMGTPIRAMGVFAPNLVRGLARAARGRHAAYNAVVNGGSAHADRIHNQWIDSMYGPFAR